MDSKVKYGQELGPNLKKICLKLADNQNLCKLLVNTDLDPLNPETHPDNIDGLLLINKNIRVIPLITPEEQNTTSKIIVIFNNSYTSGNTDNEVITFSVYVYCPFKEWLITGDSVRPFSIMSEVRKSLQDKRINGLGEITYQGFKISTLTEEMGSYIMEFEINAFS